MQTLPLHRVLSLTLGSLCLKLHSNSQEAAQLVKSYFLKEEEYMNSTRFSMPQGLLGCNILAYMCKAQTQFLVAPVPKV